MIKKKYLQKVKRWKNIITNFRKLVKVRPTEKSSQNYNRSEIVQGRRDGGHDVKS